MSAPIRRDGDAYVVELDPSMVAVIEGLCGEMETLLRDGSPLTERLFPPPYGDDEERNEGYAVLAGSELTENRLAALETVRGVLRTGRADEEEFQAWMRSLNDMRLVLGTMMGLTDEDPGVPRRPEHEQAHQVYEFLGAALEMTVMTIAGDMDEGGSRGGA